MVEPKIIRNQTYLIPKPIFFDYITPFSFSNTYQFEIVIPTNVKEELIEAEIVSKERT